jgi:hypothetical protein
MKRNLLLICGAVAAGFAGGALAGEDSTHLWNGVGPAYYQTEGGLRRFAESGGQGPLPVAAPRSEAPRRGAASKG